LLINAPFQNKVKSQNTFRVSLPNGDTMDSTHTASLYIPELSQAAYIAHVFPGMANHSLISVGQLCNEGYYITFRIDAVTIYNSTAKPILKVKRYLNTGLWRINLRHEKSQHTMYVANSINELRNTGSLVKYLNKAMFSPTKYALLQAVKKSHLITWYGLTEHENNKHFKMTPATAIGHMNQQHQNIGSTSKVLITSDVKDETVTPSGLGSNTHLVYTVVIDRGNLYIDLTGRFSVRSSKGNFYVMICYYYD
jgi:hypothetical protein